MSARPRKEIRKSGFPIWTHERRRIVEKRAREQETKRGRGEERGREEERNKKELGVGELRRVELLNFKA